MELVVVRSEEKHFIYGFFPISSKTRLTFTLTRTRRCHSWWSYRDSFASMQHKNKKFPVLAHATVAPPERCPTQLNQPRWSCGLRPVSSPTSHGWAEWPRSSVAASCHLMMHSSHTLSVCLLADWWVKSCHHLLQKCKDIFHIPSDCTAQLVTLMIP